MSKRIGVGIIGANPERGWAQAAHVPALLALPEFEIRAVSTTRQESANETAKRVGAGLAFDDHHALLARSEVDLAIIAVNVMRHRDIALAAIAAGKSVFCEWPLGRNLAEAEEIAKAARAAGVRTVIGLQGRFSSAIGHVRDLVANGYVGKVLGTSIKGSAPHEVWDGVVDPPYEFHADPANGATMLSIPAGHALDMLASVFGDFSNVVTTMVAGRGEFLRTRDGARVVTTAKDAIAVSGVLKESGALASIYYHGGPSIGPDFVWEINGTAGDLLVTGETGFANMASLDVTGSRGRGTPAALLAPKEFEDLSELSIPADNVARLYRQFAVDVAEGTRVAPDFEVALRRHRLLEAIEMSDALGSRQSL
jgi:predicted dehydrogenase